MTKLKSELAKISQLAAQSHPCTWKTFPQTKKSPLSIFQGAAANINNVAPANFTVNNLRARVYCLICTHVQVEAES